MVTLARGLMSGARLLLLDDPFQGLSPSVFQRFSETFALLRHAGVTLFIAGQHVQEILSLSQTAFLLVNGRVILSGTGAQVLHNATLQQTLLGMAGVPRSIFHPPEN